MFFRVFPSHLLGVCNNLDRTISTLKENTQQKEHIFNGEINTKQRGNALGTFSYQNHSPSDPDQQQNGAKLCLAVAHTR